MVVIADDITGAAEIAGIAFSTGRQVRLLCATDMNRYDVGATVDVTVGVTVIATDTRSMSTSEAVAGTISVGRSLPPSPSSSLLSQDSPSSFFLYKKTDSALRGHVVAELAALMQATGYRRAVYLPANPSKGRIIRNGIYYINGTPIHQTDFSFDPEFPARTSLLSERFPDAKEKGIVMPDAECVDDIRRVIGSYNDGSTLFAGAADLFTQLLPATTNTVHSPGRLTTDDALILCGSTQSRPLQLGIPIAPMPREVYDGSDDLSAWDTSVYEAGHSLILTIPHTHRTGKATAVHLRTVMAAKASQLVAQRQPRQLIIEGGATAWATLLALGWTAFDVERQIAPGVVQMRSVTSGVLVTLKPGSYPWV